MSQSLVSYACPCIYQTNKHLALAAHAGP